MRALLIAVVGLIVWSLAGLLFSQPGIRVQVRPAQAFAPQDLYVSVRVPDPQASDRIIRVVLYHRGEPVRASEWPCEGEASPRFYSFWWRDIAEVGELAAVAAVGDGRGWRAFSQQRVVLLGRDEE